MDKPYDLKRQFENTPQTDTPTTSPTNPPTTSPTPLDPTQSQVKDFNKDFIPQYSQDYGGLYNERIDAINQNYQNQMNQTQERFNNTAQQLQNMMGVQGRSNDAEMARRGLSGSGIAQQSNNLMQQQYNDAAMQYQAQVQAELNQLAQARQQAQFQQQEYVRSLEKGDFQTAWQMYNAYTQSAQYMSDVTTDWFMGKLAENRSNPKAIKDIVEQMGENMNLSLIDRQNLNALAEMYLGQPLDGNGSTRGNGEFKSDLMSGLNDPDPDKTYMENMQTAAAGTFNEFNRYFTETLGGKGSDKKGIHRIPERMRDQFRDITGDFGTMGKNIWEATVNPNSNTKPKTEDKGKKDKNAVQKADDWLTENVTDSKWAEDIRQFFKRLSY